MPMFQAMISTANTKFSHGNLGSVNPASFDPSNDFVQAAVLSGIAPSQTDQDVLKKIPLCVGEAIRAALFANFRRPFVTGESPYPVTFGWTQGVATDVTISEYPPANPKDPNSLGSLVIQLKTPLMLVQSTQQPAGS